MRAGFPTAYDLVVCVGNVMILLAPDTERTVLGVLGSLLAPHGRLLVGFSIRDAPAPTSREYPLAEFVADCESAGLQVEARFSSYDLQPLPTTATTSCTCSGRPARRLAIINRRG